jgi:hypothetical protein
VARIVITTLCDLCSEHQGDNPCAGRILTTAGNVFAETRFQKQFFLEHGYARSSILAIQWHSSFGSRRVLGTRLKRCSGFHGLSLRMCRVRLKS